MRLKGVYSQRNISKVNIKLKRGNKKSEEVPFSGLDKGFLRVILIDKQIKEGILSKIELFAKITTNRQSL